MKVIPGEFYDFQRNRVISRPGQPLKVANDPEDGPAGKKGIEIGPKISPEAALSRVKAGKDVYTLLKEDACQLAWKVAPGKPEEEPPHDPLQASPLGRVDVYFRHFHPGGNHEDYGHIFFGYRGEGYKSEKNGR